MNPQVDTYLRDGCGRCSFYKTLQCKVNTWLEELKLLRAIVNECGLVEDYKWSQPCYTYRNKNVLIVTAFKDYACISFLKGSLLQDPNNILTAPGKSSQAARQIRFTSTQDIIELRDHIKSYILQAIDAEKKGLKIEYNKNPEPIPDELKMKFGDDPHFEQAFYALTPGRQRGYIIHFSQPKQSKTRTERIEKWKPKIFQGQGMNDGYKMKNNK